MANALHLRIPALSRLALLVTRAGQPYGMSLVRPFEWRPIHRKRVGVTYNLRCDFRIQGQSQLIPALTVYVDCGKSKRVRNPDKFAKRVVAQTLEMLSQYIKIEAGGVRR